MSLKPSLENVDIHSLLLPFFPAFSQQTISLKKEHWKFVKIYSWINWKCPPPPLPSSSYNFFVWESMVYLVQMTRCHKTLSPAQTFNINRSNSRRTTTAPWLWPRPPGWGRVVLPCSCFSTYCRSTKVETNQAWGPFADGVCIGAGVGVGSSGAASPVHPGAGPPKLNHGQWAWNPFENHFVLL